MRRLISRAATVRPRLPDTSTLTTVSTTSSFAKADGMGAQWDSHVHLMTIDGSLRGGKPRTDTGGGGAVSAGSCRLWASSAELLLRAASLRQPRQRHGTARDICSMPDVRRLAETV